MTDSTGWSARIPHLAALFKHGPIYKGAGRLSSPRLRQRAVGQVNSALVRKEALSSYFCLPDLVN